jgi:hypothetical protein
VTGCELGDWGFISGMVEKTFLFVTTSRPPLPPDCPLAQYVSDPLFPGVKANWVYVSFMLFASHNFTILFIVCGAAIWN